MTCDENILVELLASVNSIEQELGPTPEGIYASVRTRLDILEARINNPNLPAPSVDNPFYIGNSGITIRDGYGDPNLALPPYGAIPGSLYLREDGDLNLYSMEEDGYWQAVNFEVFEAGGDLSGDLNFQTVIGIQNRPVAATAPAVGNMYLWNGSTWTPSFLPLNDGYVTGQLPAANIGLITVTGDVTGSGSGGSVSTTVGKIQGMTVTSGALTKGNLFIATSTSNWGGITVTGDVNFSATAPGVTVVTAIHGVAVPANPSLNQVLVATAATTSAWEAISGDLTNSLGNFTVNSIQGITISGTPSVGYVLEATSSSAASWQAPSGDITLAGDVTGSATSNVLSKIHNVTLPVPSGVNTVLQYNASALTWAPIPSSFPPSGTAGGDLDGTYPDPIVAALQTNPISSLVLDSLQDGYLLTWTGISWTALPPNVLATNTITSSYQINSVKNDYYIFCNFSAPGTVTLPDPLAGAKYEIWDVSGTAGSGNTITLLPYASESIFGVPANPIASNYGHLSIVSDGINWFLSP